MHYVANVNSVMAWVMFQHGNVFQCIAKKYVGILDLSTRW